MTDAEQEAEVERLRPSEHEGQEERQREQTHPRREDRAHVIVRAGCGWPAFTARHARRRGRGRRAARAEEVRLGVEPSLGHQPRRLARALAIGGSEYELVVVHVALAQQREGQQRVRQHVRRPDVVKVREREREEEQPAHHPARRRHRHAGSVTERLIRRAPRHTCAPRARLRRGARPPRRRASRQSSRRRR